jgi:hypothetical protein
MGKGKTMAYKRMPRATLSIGERWCNSFLVTYPVSYRYNGGIIVDGKWYEGYKVPSPKVPKGFTLRGIGCGLQLNVHPPYATAYLKPDDDKKINKIDLYAKIQS